MYKLDFDHSSWQNVSAAGKDLISRLLVVDPTKRLSANDILQHEWLACKPRTQQNSSPAEQQNSSPAQQQASFPLAASPPRTFAPLKHSPSEEDLENTTLFSSVSTNTGGPATTAGGTMGPTSSYMSSVGEPLEDISRCVSPGLAPPDAGSSLKRSVTDWCSPPFADRDSGTYLMPQASLGLLGTDNLRRARMIKLLSRLYK